MEKNRRNSATFDSDSAFPHVLARLNWPAVARNILSD